MADYYLDINGLSKHLNTDVEYNEQNYGFGVTREDVKDKLVKTLTAGGYKNSFGKPSYYAGGGLAKRFGDDYYMDLGGMVGAATGYDKAISPIAAAIMSVGKKDLAKLNMMYAPETEKSPSLIMMNLGIPFK